MKNLTSTFFRSLSRLLNSRNSEIVENEELKKKVDKLEEGGKQRDLKIKRLEDAVKITIFPPRVI